MWPFSAKNTDSRPCGYPPGAEPFLTTICADRADDTARLVFADWLQENGDDERAEFIRLQCDLQRINPDYGSPGAHDALALNDRAKVGRQAELLRTNLAAWTAGFPTGMLSLAHRPFARGFPRAVFATVRRWREHGERVRAWVPVEAVHIEGEAERYADLVTLPSLFGLNELTLTRVGTDEVRARRVARA